MTDEPSPSADVPDELVYEMVRHLEPSWDVQSIDRASHGTDFVAFLEVGTPEGVRTVVLKASTAEWVEPETARAEPRMLALVGRETTIPVPAVFGYCDDHDTLPAPFYLMEYVDGENYEGNPHSLSDTVREQICREAGRNLAQLHTLGSLESVGRLGVQNGELTVLDTEESPRYDEFHDWLLASYEDTLESLTSGGYFPDLADDKRRFADIVPEVRQYLRETIPKLSAPNPPTYCHQDYRYGNLLVDPETGTAQAVLDWGVVLSASPAFNIANAESLLLTPDSDDAERTDELRQALRTAYTDTRDDWSFDEATRERMRIYRLTCRLDAMACLPLWYQDASPSERDERAAAYREAVVRYL
ncbi:phosphotransferase [Halobacteria archaeon AArc-m2/3/4]|uniref:Phosphotransferase n=1 Tax=Natronoglomus mannanivorans TaxID=2979990 RepID=A0AAP2YZU4_9EURY|nr:phosphotransferase [Halobacteria archaeon AArc-xg1-1]MCU4975189.1 phosphotransferase [Halobacteria archaeon AArc-m2/3/4]